MIRALVSDKLKKSLGEKESSFKTKTSKVADFNRKIEKLRERLMNEEIEASAFKTGFRNIPSKGRYY